MVGAAIEIDVPHRQVPGRRYDPGPDPASALVVEDKWLRVRNFRAAILQALSEIVAAAGLDHPNEFMPMHFSRRVSPREVVSFDKHYPTLRPGELLDGTDDPRLRVAWKMASAESFRPV